MTTMQLPGELLDVEATSIPAIEIVIPVHNEEHDLEPSVRRLHAYLTTTFPLSFRITIADNASTDGTWAIACALEAELVNVRATYLNSKGRGRALHTVWLASTAEVVCYMDVDLSTDLSALLPLVAPLLSGHSDVAIGTRSGSHAGAVREARRRGQASLLHRRQRRHPERRQQRVVRHLVLGEQSLHRNDNRWRHAIRPDQGHVVVRVVRASIEVQRSFLRALDFNAFPTRPPARRAPGRARLIGTHRVQTDYARAANTACPKCKG